MMLPDVVETVEDEEVELGLPGRSPPLTGVSVSTPEPVELGILVDSARAVTDVEVVKVDDVDPDATEVLVTEEEPLLENVGPVGVTVVVVEPVGPRLPPGAEDMHVSGHLVTEMPKTYFLLILEPHLMLLLLQSLK
jgi:hypothetical protein